MRERVLSKHPEKSQQGASLSPKTGPLQKKKEQASPALKIVSTLFPRKILDLILIAGLTLLVRARAPPETWTTRLQPSGQSEPALLDHLFRLVTNFSNDCSKFEQLAK